MELPILVEIKFTYLSILHIGSNSIETIEKLERIYAPNLKRLNLSN